MKKKIIILFILIALFYLVFSFFSQHKTNTLSPIIPTPSPVKPSPSDTSIKQIPDDYKYSEALVDIHQQYPWYSKLPIETEDYRIIYDFDKKSFRIRILTVSSQSIKQEALNKLKSIGIDINKYSYYFLEP